MSSEQVLPKKRNLLIDAGKGIGILLVVFGHALQTNIPDFDNILFRVIYSFHMPLFMLLSGCVAKYGDYRSITKNITRLVIPFLAWHIVAAFVHWFQTGQRPNLYAGLIALFKSPDWGLWFLWVLFLCHVCFYAMSVAQKYVGLIGAIIVFIAVQFIPLNILGVGLLKWHFVFFVAGFLVIKYKDLITKWRFYLMPLAAIVYCLLFPYWQFVTEDIFLSAVSHLRPIDAHSGKYLIKLFRYLTAFSGIGLVMSLTYFLIKWRPIEVILTTIGIYTLEIYVSHQLMLGYGVGHYIALRVATCFAAALSLSLIVAYILKKIPIVNSILYGLPFKKLGSNALPNCAQS